MRKSNVPAPRGREAAWRPGARALAALVCGVLAGAAGGCARPPLRPTPGPGAAPTGQTAAEPGGKSRFITSLDLLSFESLADYDLDPRAFVAWIKRLGPQVDAELAGDAADRTVQIQVTMHRDRDAEIAIAASPPLAEPRRRQIADHLQKSQPPRTLLTDYTVRFVAQVNRGAADREASCTPRLERPTSELLARVRAASLKDRLGLISGWARQEALPVLARVMRDAPERLEGVRSLGQLLSGLDLSRPISVAEILDHNPQYWRAMTEVQNGNPLVPAARIFLHVANGELDVARLYLKPIYYFSKSDNLAHDYIELFKEMIIIFQSDLDERINRGVELHDRGLYKEAISIYDGVLAEYPCSSLAMYEKFFSRTMMPEHGDNLDEWQKYRPRVYACNPMFTIDPRTHGKRERFQALRRQAIRSLFKRERDSASDWVKMADIALDVDEYGFSAHLYYLISNVVDPANYDHRNLLAYWLYCLEKLGVTTIKDHFKGDHQSDFERIADERQQMMDSEPLAAPQPQNRPGI